MELFGFGNKKKFEELKKYVEEENYDAAVIVADQIPIHKAKTISELNLIGKAYKKHEDFLLAREFFERSYTQRVSRPVLMDLMDCCLEIKDLESTERYFNEYQKLAPEDKVTQYKYRYEIEKRKGRERNLLIMILEELKVLEYIEEYAYELALQYHKAKRKQECINECNDIILWFGVGDSVERARILLAYYRGEIELDEVESEGLYYPRKQVILTKKKEEENEEEAWLMQKAAKLREEVRKIEETASFQDEVRKAEEAARAREKARRAEEVKRIQEVQKEEGAKRERTQIEKLKKVKEIKKVEDIAKTREEAKRFEEIRRAEEITRARKELKRAEEAVAKAKEEARRIEETIKVQEEISCASQVEEAVELIEDAIEKKVDLLEEDTKNVASEIENTLAQNQWKESEPLFCLATEEIEVSQEEYKELADLLEKKKISLSEILKSFGRIDSVKQQVFHSVNIALKTKEHSFFIVMGEVKSGKTTLALTMIKLLFELGLIQYDRTAIIDAVQLNQVSIKEYSNQLKNCNVIIQHAASMTEKTIESFVDFFRENKEETCLFLEDSEDKIKEMLTSKREWTILFYNQIALKEYTAQELMGIAYDYITKEDYSIDSMAAQVLFGKIDEIVKFHGKESSLFYVMQLIKETLRHAENRVSNILLGMVSQGKIQLGEYLVILPEDIA